MVAKFFRCEQLAEAALFEGSCLLNELGTQNVVRCVCWWLEEKVQDVFMHSGANAETTWSNLVR